MATLRNVRTEATVDWPWQKRARVVGHPSPSTWTSFACQKRNAKASAGDLLAASCNSTCTKRNLLLLTAEHGAGFVADAAASTPFFLDLHLRLRPFPSVDKCPKRRPGHAYYPLQHMRACFVGRSTGLTTASSLSSQRHLHSLGAWFSRVCFATVSSAYSGVGSSLHVSFWVCRLLFASSAVG